MAKWSVRLVLRALLVGVSALHLVLVFGVKGTAKLRGTGHSVVSTSTVLVQLHGSLGVPLVFGSN